MLRETEDNDRTKIIFPEGYGVTNKVQSVDQFIANYISEHRSKRWVIRSVVHSIVTRLIATAGCVFWSAPRTYDFPDLPPPPCTLQQALRDPDFVDDPACSPSSGFSLCWLFHKGAHHCFRSRNPG